MCGEPFCWTPDRVGEVTDQWFLEVILKPAAQRTAAQRNRGRPSRGSPTLKRMPTRQEFISGGVLLGGDAEEMGRGYDAWAAKQKGATGGEDS